MKIYFTCSTAEFVRYQKFYYAIRNHIVEKGHLLTRDWLSKTDKRIQNGAIEIADIKEIYEGCIDSIKQADAVIIEDTISNFSTGHQITLALQWQKPTLVLWSKPKHRHFKQMFIHGIDSELLEVKEYNLVNYKDIIDSFFKRFEGMDKKNRFHLVISESERRYLDWVQYNKGQSRTKVLRKALRKLMDEDSGYLSGE